MQCLLFAGLTATMLYSFDEAWCMWFYILIVENI